MHKHTLTACALFFLMTVVNSPVRASDLLFVIGPQPSSIPTVAGEAVGPYPGQLTGSTIGQFLCLDGNITTYWGSNIYGTEAHPVTQQEDEAAFLASLLLYDADQLGVTLNSFSAPNPDPSYTQSFMNNYSGPVTFALWQIFGTMTAAEAANAPAGTQAFVDLAASIYTNVFSNTSSPEYTAGQTFLQSVWIFTPTKVGSNQRFITAVPNDTFMSTVLNGPLNPTVPEPGTIGLLAAGCALIAIVYNRK
jgi:hypothetical protein